MKWRNELATQVPRPRAGIQPRLHLGGVIMKATSALQLSGSIDSAVTPKHHSVTTVGAATGRVMVLEGDEDIVALRALDRKIAGSATAWYPCDAPSA